MDVPLLYNSFLLVGGELVSFKRSLQDWELELVVIFGVHSVCGTARGEDD